MSSKTKERIYCVVCRIPDSPYIEETVESLDQYSVAIGSTQQGVIEAFELLTFDHLAHIVKAYASNRNYRVKLAMPTMGFQSREWLDEFTRILSPYTVETCGDEYLSWAPDKSWSAKQILEFLLDDYSRKNKAGYCPKL